MLQTEPYDFAALSWIDFWSRFRRVMRAVCVGFVEFDRCCLRNISVRISTGSVPWAFIGVHTPDVSFAAATKPPPLLEIIPLWKHRLKTNLSGKDSIYWRWWSSLVVPKTCQYRRVIMCSLNSRSPPTVFTIYWRWWSSLVVPKTYQYRRVIMCSESLARCSRDLLMPLLYQRHQLNVCCKMNQTHAISCRSAAVELTILHRSAYSSIHQGEIPTIVHELWYDCMRLTIVSYGLPVAWGCVNHVSIVAQPGTPKSVW